MLLHLRVNSEHLFDELLEREDLVGELLCEELLDSGGLTEEFFCDELRARGDLVVELFCDTLFLRYDLEEDEYEWLFGSSLDSFHFSSM